MKRYGCLAKADKSLVKIRIPSTHQTFRAARPHRLFGFAQTTEDPCVSVLNTALGKLYGCGDRAMAGLRLVNSV